MVYPESLVKLPPTNSRFLVTLFLIRKINDITGEKKFLLPTICVYENNINNNNKSIPFLKISLYIKDYVR